MAANIFIMKKARFYPIFCLLFLLPCCRQKSAPPAAALIKDIQLKTGPVISCGPPDAQFGSAVFEVRGDEEVKKDFNFAVTLLHSFEYDEAEKAFAKVIAKEPGCALAYWGVAMSNFHPLWAPPTESELKKGAKAIQAAQSLKMSERETAYMNAIASFYTGWDKTDHRTRCLDFEKAMANVYAKYPEDKEAAVFYALALNAAADPADKSFSKQKKAGALLSALYPGQPNHPGLAHYLIHTYDYPELAKQGLDAARNYASIAPSSAHALHMPSHIFTRLGLWDECIRSNRASVESAKCYAEAAGIKGHWDEELHGLDYLMYAYLQKGEADSAKKQLAYLNTITDVSPVNFKVAYAYAAIPARYLLENKLWEAAANLKAGPVAFPWKAFPWQEAIVHFSRLLGAVHIGSLNAAKEELTALTRIHDTLIHQKDSYKAAQVAIQIKAAEAWMHLKEGKHKEALTLMQQAAELEDNTGKHPVTPGEVLPARELLGDMLLQMNKPDEALKAYEAELEKHPNRFNALYGAGTAAEKSGAIQKATTYFRQLIRVVGNAKSDRIEVSKSKAFLKRVSAV